MGEVIWTDGASADLREIVTYIAADSERRAKRFQSKIIAATESLSRFPRFAGKVPEFDLDEYREVIVRPYRIVYRINGENCLIIGVIHGFRRLEDALNLEDFDESSS